MCPKGTGYIISSSLKVLQHLGMSKKVLHGWLVINGRYSLAEELKDMKNRSLAEMAKWGSRIPALVHGRLNTGNQYHCKKNIKLFFGFRV